MGIQHEEAAPASFSEAFSDTYLGSPDVVARLVAQFCAQTEASIQELRLGRISPAQFTGDLLTEVRRYADIFSGRDAAYKTVMGYHEHTLRFRLMADLGAFWQKHRAKWGDDPVCVLFEWLAVILAEKIKLADGDDMLLEVMLEPTVEYTVGVLLGTGKRATA